MAVNHKQVYCRNVKLLTIAIEMTLDGSFVIFCVDMGETVTAADFLGRSPTNAEVSVWDGKSRKILNFTV